MKAVASEGKGIPEIAAKISDHRSFLDASGGLSRRRRTRLQHRISELVTDKLHVDFWTIGREALLHRRMEEVMSLKATPYEVAFELIEDFRKSTT